MLQPRTDVNPFHDPCLLALGLSIVLGSLLAGEQDIALAPCTLHEGWQITAAVELAVREVEKKARVA